MRKPPLPNPSFPYEYVQCVAVCCSALECVEPYVHLDAFELDSTTSSCSCTLHVHAFEQPCTAAWSPFMCAAPTCHVVCCTRPPIRGRLQCKCTKTKIGGQGQQEGAVCRCKYVHAHPHFVLKMIFKMIFFQVQKCIASTFLGLHAFFPFCQGS